MLAYLTNFPSLHRLPLSSSGPFMRISVVMPTYNRAAILDRAIRSVLSQTHADLEMIVVDDGSIDNTAEVLAAYNDARLIHLRHSPNRGGNYARNRGIERASGEIVSFIDSDDEFLSHKLACVAKIFSARPDLDGLVDSFVIHRQRGEGLQVTERNNPPLDDPDEFRTAVFARRLYKATPAISARRRALLEIGMFDETLRRRQDMDLLLRLCRKHRCMSIADRLWIKHWTVGAISTKRDTFVEAAIAICERHPEYISHPAYRAGLERDIGRHFLRLAKAGEWSVFRRDLRRLAQWRQLDASPWRLMLRRLLQRGRKRLVASRQRRENLRHP
jgi:glycosyltransferase involved in cell wall biosynthesis